MKALVTGGAGFIGSHLVDRLIADGDSVTVYDNLSSGKEAFIKEHFGSKIFRFVKADLLDLKRIIDTTKGHDIVYHLAANPQAREGIRKTNLDLEQNTVVTYNVLESMRVNNVRKIVFTSSGTVYGEKPDIAIPEDYGPMLPISLYGASKLACEGMIAAFCSIFDMTAVIVRPGNIIGPRATHGVIFDLIKKLEKDSTELEVLGNGNQTKPYVYIDDFIDGLLVAVQNARERVEVLNLAVSSETNVKNIVRMILEKTRSRRTIRYTGARRGWPGDIPEVRLSTKKLEEMGWTAKLSSDQAVAKTIDALIAREQ
jgi:UDP-glucose 4-epimerase